MTAVEWLYEQLNGLNKPILDDYFQIVFSKAKEMEKQQIIDSWDNGYETGYGYLSSKFDNAEQYYNETFKK